MRFYGSNMGKSGLMGGGTRGAPGATTCRPASRIGAQRYNYPFSSNILAYPSEGGIDGRGICTTADCYATNPVKGLECHNDKGHEFFPDPNDWLWRKNIANSNGDGLNEWLCLQVTLEGLGTNNMNYRYAINEKVLIDMRGLKGRTTRDSHFSKLEFGSYYNGNYQGNTAYRVSDNYHFTKSATPIPCENIGFPKFSNATKIEQNPAEKLSLHQNKMNLLHNSASLSFQLPEKQKVNLSVHTLEGRKIATIAEGQYNAGLHSVEWSAAEQSAGVYLFVLKAGSQKLVKRGVVIR